MNKIVLVLMLVIEYKLVKLNFKSHLGIHACQATYYMTPMLWKYRVNFIPNSYSLILLAKKMISTSSWSKLVLTHIRQEAKYMN